MKTFINQTLGMKICGVLLLFFTLFISCSKKDEPISLNQLKETAWAGTETSPSNEVEVNLYFDQSGRATFYKKNKNTKSSWTLGPCETTVKQKTILLTCQGYRDELLFIAQYDGRSMILISMPGSSEEKRMELRKVI